MNPCAIYAHCSCYNTGGECCLCDHAYEPTQEPAPDAYSKVPAPLDANPKKAYGDRKIPLHLVPPALIIGAAKAFAEGAAKYGPYNWRSTKVELLTYIGAIQRHLSALLDGEDFDPESTQGKLHLDGIAANVAIALDAYHGGFLIDNRPPPGPAPRLILTPKEPK